MWHGLVVAQSGGIYVCVDAKGRKLTSDRPIPECIDREQRELGPSGSVRRTIAPTLTAQERSLLEAQQRQLQDEANKLQEQKRRDKVLMARFPNREAHDKVRADSLVQINELIKSAQGEVAQVLKQRKQLDQEMEFYKRDPVKVPMALKRQYESNDASLALQQSYIKEQEAEKNRVNARFDAELVKLNQLWSGAPSATR
ncbi:MAG: DUF4124 domain-containing protein [Betaproteobacteria bacterium]|nr:DUF4124 domain-containing protein [Betaproteobacteria bacterium]